MQSLASAQICHERDCDGDGDGDGGIDGDGDGDGDGNSDGKDLKNRVTNGLGMDMIYITA